jgi:AcrR family transcriptional regulator
LRRGDELRQHILFKAKEVFLEAGFEGASMDLIAARAQTTKRTVYAHFENKERLFLAVVDLIRDLFASKVKWPADYAEDPTEALVLFCARLQQIVLWGPAVRTSRLGIAEAERFPQGSIRFYEAIFGTAQQRIARFLQEHFGLSRRQSAPIAEEILGRVLHLGFLRALFGVERVSEKLPDDNASSRAADLAPIRSFISQLVPRASRAAL